MRLWGEGWVWGKGGGPLSSQRRCRMSWLEVEVSSVWKCGKALTPRQSKQRGRELMKVWCWVRGMDQPRMCWSQDNLGTRLCILSLRVPRTEGQRLSYTAPRETSLQVSWAPVRNLSETKGLGPNWEGPSFSKHSSREAFYTLAASPSPPRRVSHFSSPVQSPWTAFTIRTSSVPERSVC